MAPTRDPDLLAERLDFRVAPVIAERLRLLARTEETTLGTILRRAVRLLLEREDEREPGEAGP